MEMANNKGEVNITRFFAFAFHPRVEKLMEDGGDRTSFSEFLRRERRRNARRNYAGRRKKKDARNFGG